MCYYSLPINQVLLCFVVGFHVCLFVCFFFLVENHLLGYAFLTQRISLTTPDFVMEQSSDSRMVIKHAENRKSVSSLVFCVF